MLLFWSKCCNRLNRISWDSLSSDSRALWGVLQIITHESFRPYLLQWYLQRRKYIFYHKFSGKLHKLYLYTNYRNVVIMKLNLAKYWFNQERGLVPWKQFNKRRIYFSGVTTVVNNLLHETSLVISMFTYNYKCWHQVICHKHVED